MAGLSGPPHYLGQLLAAKILDSEQVFHVDGMPRTKKADNIFNTPKTTLSRGENGFGYVLFSDESTLSQTEGPATLPVIVAPISNGGKLPTFHHKLFHGEGIALHLDFSVGVYKIDEKGHLLSKDTEKNIFLTGEGTIWGKQEPLVKEPWLLPEEKKKEAK